MPPAEDGLRETAECKSASPSAHRHVWGRDGGVGKGVGDSPPPRRRCGGLRLLGRRAS